MSDMSEQPSTWSYKTTKILVICFVFFIIVPIIGFTTESNSFETLTNPEKSHPSHMMDLENNESGSITLFPEHIYTIYTKSSTNSINKNNIIVINEVGNEIEANSTPIFVSLFSENGETYDAISTWKLVEESNVEIQNSIGQKIWLVNESGIISSIQENDILVGSALSCITSICLIPVIIIWFIINRPNPKALNIKFVNEDEENSTHVELIQLQNRVPNSDELYRAIHGNESMKNELKEEIQKEIEKESIPAPFADRPDGVAIKKEKIVFEEKYNSPKIIEVDEEKDDRWKEWDG